MKKTQKTTKLELAEVRGGTPANFEPVPVPWRPVYEPVPVPWRPIVVIGH